MPAPSAGAVLRLWFEEVWNQCDPSRIEAHMAPHGIVRAVDETGADAHGPAAFRAFFERFLDCFSDIRFTMHEVIEAGPLAAGRWSARLTHSGPGLGVAPTGQSLELTGMAMVRVEDGKIVEGWNEWNRMALATGLGLLVPSAR